MGRIAKKSDLEKDDVKNFSIGLTEAKALKITKQDLKGIKEVIPDVKYKIRTTSGDNRKAETFSGTLMDAIKRKYELVNEQMAITENKKDYNNMMMLDGIDEYVKYQYERVQRDNLDINTFHGYLKHINGYIKEFFYPYKINDLSSELIEKFINWLREKPNKTKPSQKLSEQSIDNYVTVLSTIITFFHKKKHWIPSNPLYEVENKPQPKKTKKELNYFQLDDAIYALKCLDKYADIRLKAFMGLIFSLGCRREEACGLRWCDVNFDDKSVDYTYATTSSVPASFLKEHGVFDNDQLNNDDSQKKFKRIRTKGLKSFNSYRTNFLSDNSLNYLRQYYKYKIAYGEDIKPEDPIFTNWLNDDLADPSKLSEQWRNFKRKYDIKDVDLHRIRHTVASILEKSGVPKKDIAKMLGNTERVLEEFYTHVDVGDLKRLRTTLDDKLYNNVELLDINIDLAVKVLNEYPIETLSRDELNTLDLISSESINSDNYLENISVIKNMILDSNSKLDYFIEKDLSELDIKVQTYKVFNSDDTIRIQRIKDISINRDILSF